MRVTILASGSRGNATLVSTGQHCILVDAGIAPRKMRRLLRSIHGRVPRQVDAVIITHGHGDHARHAAAAARSFDAQLFLSKATAQSRLLEGCPDATIFHPGDELTIGSLRVATFPLPHDVPQISLVIADGDDRVGIATDLGEVPPGLLDHLSGCRTLLIESNHDIALLKNGSYPPFLKNRILSKSGHISNETCAALLRQMPRGLRTVVLMHLSEENNDPNIALKSARQALRGRGVRIYAASQNQPLSIGGTYGQLTLPLGE